MEFTSFDGKNIYVHEWTDVKEPKGVVQIVHGMAEHAARYDPFARFLNDHGYVVIADDHRGHGLTDRETLGYCKGNMFADTLKDEASLTDFYRRKYAGLPYFLFGFSYGSFIAQAYLGQYGDKLDGIVIGGSNHKKDFEVYLGSFVAGMGCIFGAKKPSKLIEKLSFGAYAKKFENGQWLSNDLSNNLGYDQDPLSGFTCSNRFYKDFFKGLRGLYTKKYAMGLPRELPVLLISGADDPVGDMGKGVKKLAAYYREQGMKNLRMVLFEKSRHEFLNERDGREEKWGTVLSFFDKVFDEKV